MKGVTADGRDLVDRGGRSHKSGAQVRVRRDLSGPLGPRSGQSTGDGDHRRPDTSGDQQSLGR